MLPWMPMDEITEYHACDIDRRTSVLLNRYFNMLRMPCLASDIDIIACIPRCGTDVAFLFKLTPVLENQLRGRVYEILDKIDTGQIVVTYPYTMRNK